MPSPWLTVSEGRQRAVEMQVQLSTPMVGGGVVGGVGVVSVGDGPVGWGEPGQWGFPQGVLKVGL